MGVEIRVEGLTKRFGSQTIWEDVTLTLPPGEISVLLGPSGTGKSVFLKSLIGLLKPNKGHIYVDGKDVPNLSERELYEVRKLFGVLFQDGALFGSMNLFDNIAFPLREHTKKGEGEIKNIVLEKMEMVGLLGSEAKLPGEISGGMRKRAGLARALVLDPEVVLFDEPDSGLDPVRVAYLNQLIVDLNAQIGATFLIVTHDIGTARTVPDNIGLLFRRNLVMFGPRDKLLSSKEPVVRQFLNGRMEGPIGMSEEKDVGQVEKEMASLEARGGDTEGGAGRKGDDRTQRLQPSAGIKRPEGYQRDQDDEAAHEPGHGEQSGDGQDGPGDAASHQQADGQQAEGQQADGKQADGKQADEPAPDLVDSEPDISNRAAIAVEREVAPEGGQPLDLRQPVDQETGAILDRPSSKNEDTVTTTGTSEEVDERQDPDGEQGGSGDGETAQADESGQHTEASAESAPRGQDGADQHSDDQQPADQQSADQQSGDQARVGRHEAHNESEPDAGDQPAPEAHGEDGHHETGQDARAHDEDGQGGGPAPYPDTAPTQRQHTDGARTGDGTGNLESPAAAGGETDGSKEKAGVGGSGNGDGDGGLRGTFSRLWASRR